jgi:mRNA interferase RelE/StbE
MDYHLEFLPGAADDLIRLDKVVAQRILDKLKRLTQHFDELTPEMLKGEFRGLYKLRAGSYRIIYAVNKEQLLITVHLIGHRRDLYNK